MTNAAVLNKASNLVMPTHYVELDRDEMSYVEGGVFLGITLSAAQCVQFCTMAASGIGTVMKSAKAMSIISSKIVSLFLWVHGLPVFGQIVFGVIVAAALTLVALIVSAAFMNKGLKLGFDVDYKPAGFLGLFGKWTVNPIFEMA